MDTIITKMPGRSRSYKARDSLSIGYPWISFGAIMALEEIIKPEFNVLEFGSGGSTIFFSRACKTVITFEHDPIWAESVKSVMGSNVTLHLANVRRTLRILSGMKELYDIVFVDSGPTYGRRRIILDNCSRFVKKEGYLVVDNYAVRPLRDFDYTDFEVYIFDSIRGRKRGTLIGVRK